jgi:hypothetical protein
LYSFVFDTIQDSQHPVSGEERIALHMMDVNNNKQDHQEEGRRQCRQLSLEEQQTISTLECKSDLPPYVQTKIDEALRVFLSKVKTSIQDIFFEDDEVEVEGGEQEQRRLVKTIIDTDWQREEEQYEAAIRLFPNVLSDKRDELYPIQCMAMRHRGNMHNLKSVSLIPLVAELGIELHQFDEELRGGLLSTIYHRGYNMVMCISGYYRKENKTGLVDECFLAVMERLRKNNHLRKEDIQQYNLVGDLCTTDCGYFLERMFLYFVDWDPKVLSTPCTPDYGNWMPIHWSGGVEHIGAREKSSAREMFSSILEASLFHFPEKIGFLFCEGTQMNEEDENDVETGTPFQLAYKKFGRESVIKEVMDQIAKHYPIDVPSVDVLDDVAPTSTTTITTTTTTTATKSFMLLLAANVEKIHLDGLYMILHRDPTASLSRLQQILEEEEQDGQQEG